MLENITLQHLFENKYNRSQWLEAMRAMLGKIDIYATPSSIALKKNDWNAKGHILGRFETVDQREIGIYEVSIGSDVKLEKNRVSLRNLLKSVYENDVDAALIVFDQGQKWRFSYVSEIRTRNTTTGKTEKQSTDPKRYTYVFGKKGTYRTPIQRFQKLTPGFIYMKDITDAFSVSELNTEFYNDVVHFFYQLTGASVGKGKNKTEYKPILKLPDTPVSEKRIYQEFAVRLIGRIIFCWFLKYKKSPKEIPLLPDELLSSAVLKNQKNYYHEILELLFFQVLNTPMEKRKNNLPVGSDWIPFLNGGLFEAHPHDFYSPDRAGLSKNINTLKLPDAWFQEFFSKLEQYNFTIDENSIDDAEVSIDPEMLGRIFENLLAEIDPDTGESARKATGSFYTPREIVDYMVGESLTQYLHKHTEIDKVRIHRLFDLSSSIVIGDSNEPDKVGFNSKEIKAILTELDKIKILDPACGSGAFPIGALQKILLALEKLDKDALWWKERQVEKITNTFLRNQLKKKLDTATVDYTRKLGLIQNNIYGVDIQPIAAEISKLRCFLTLIVDEQIDDKKENRGVEPLPNLEFKFIAANTLYRLPDDPQGDIFGNTEALDELRQIRLDYLQAFGDEKEELKKKFKQLQTKIFKKESKLTKNLESRTMKLAAWDPFGDDCTNWFDGEWMYGVNQFDVVIGNPPYGGDKIEDNLKNELVLGSKDPYGAFVARFLHKPTTKTHLKQGGILCFIVSDTFMTIKTHLPLRELLVSNVMHKMVRVHPDTFKATVNTAILLIERHEKLNQKSLPTTGQLLLADLTQVSIHEKHHDFLHLLKKTVSYISPLNAKQTSMHENDVLYMQGDFQLPKEGVAKWTSESSPLYGIYSYPQSYIDICENKPFFVASPKLYLLVARSNVKSDSHIKGMRFEGKTIAINNKQIKIVDLKEMGEVNQGISTGDNKFYLRRKTQGEGYEEVDIERVLPDSIIAQLSDEEKMNGVSKRKYGNKYYVPFDKGADSDTEQGWMPNYFVSPQYYINWSKESVDRMKTLTIAERKKENGEKPSPGDDAKIAAALRNRERWFKPSINFSPTGYYSPTFRIGPGTLSQNTSSTIVVDKKVERYILGNLCSKFAKYLLKNFFNHTVHTQEGDVIQFPIVIHEVGRVEEIVAEIIEKQKRTPDYNYSKEQSKLDDIFYRAYGLIGDDIDEVENWYARKYPKLVAAQQDNLKKRSKELA